jgi:hypothetical protein
VNDTTFTARQVEIIRDILVEVACDQDVTTVGEFVRVMAGIKKSESDELLTRLGFSREDL